MRMRWHQVLCGTALALSGFLAATATLIYLALFTQGGPDDALGTGVFIGALIATAALTALVVITTRLRRAATHPGLTRGLLLGTAVGVVLHLTATTIALDIRDNLWSGCPCEPLIDHYRATGHFTMTGP